MVASVRSVRRTFRLLIAQHRERLWRSHFVRQVQIDIQHSRGINRFRDDLVSFPDFFQRGFWVLAGS